ncbi:MAG TPA: carbonic anhydrase [Methanothrix sp.]|nr:carbonic anhydrase [Methanothrix sp.]HPJ84425.1 carbonic anhydrase [Methanothrix sp.]HPR67089.1 carbonic anhydrase [Methanothrix sp.]
MAAFLCLAACLAGAIASEEEAEGAISADDAWDILMEGNARFVSGDVAAKNFPERRAELVSGQSPFVTVVTCSDSRVPPELIFDQGLGDIFVIRVAGNVMDPVVLGSVEYGVEHLHTPLLVILGHSSCGAVTAATQGGAEGNIESIMTEIEPAVEVARETNLTGSDLVEDAIDENVDLVIKNVLDRSSITKELVEDGKLVILGAKYSLETGEVAVLTKVDASNVAEMAVEEEEKVAVAGSEETTVTAIPEDVIPEGTELESSIPEDIIPEGEASDAPMNE